MSTKEQYFKWLCSFIQPTRGRELTLKYLFHTPFILTGSDTVEEMDENRAWDGKSLRDRFIEDNDIKGFDWPDEYEWFEHGECSVLEMMVALAERMEHDVAGDPEGQDNTAAWFWEMMNNLFPDEGYLDVNYDNEVMVETMDRLLSRMYSYNGHGGLFIVEHPQQNMRDTDIWTQAMWYLAENVVVFDQF